MILLLLQKPVSLPALALPDFPPGAFVLLPDMLEARRALEKARVDASDIVYLPRSVLTPDMDGMLPNESALRPLLTGETYGTKACCLSGACPEPAKSVVLKYFTLLRAETAGVVFSDRYVCTLLLLLLHWASFGYARCDVYTLPGKLWDRLLAYIGTHPADASLQSTAAFLGRTPAYLSRLVRMRTGKTFTEIVTERKMESAKRLLAGSDATEAEVAAAIGFSSLRCFRRAFRTHCAMTPLQYRKEAAIESEVRS